MIDPITAISAASTAFTLAKKAVAVGRDMEDMWGHLSRWASNIEDAKEYLNQEKEYGSSKPKVLKKIQKSATQEALDSIVLENKINEQEKLLREWFTANWQADWGGIEGYRKFIKKRREIKEKREQTVYRKMRARKDFLYKSRMGVAIAVLSGLLMYLIYFLINAVTEASK
jgi:hypothetical protein